MRPSRSSLERLMASCGTWLAVGCGALVAFGAGAVCAHRGLLPRAEIGAWFEQPLRASAPAPQTSPATPASPAQAQPGTNADGAAPGSASSDDSADDPTVAPYLRG